MSSHSYGKAGLLALALLAVPTVCGAQTPTVDTSQPIVTQARSAKPRTVTFLGDVISSTEASITVRSRENARLIRTFSYTPAVHQEIARIRARGGYQYGDRVAIIYAVGSDVALRIKGKPSAPKYF